MSTSYSPTRWQPFEPEWIAVGQEAALDVAALWSDSGCQHLSPDARFVPDRLVRQVISIVRWLDGFAEGSSKLAQTTPGDGLGLLTERAAYLGLGPSGRTSCGGGTRLIKCRDGWMAVSLARPEDLGLIPAWLETSLAPDSVTEAWPHIEAEVVNRSASDLVARAIMLGMACVTLGQQSTPSYAGTTAANRSGKIHPGQLMQLGGADPVPLSGLNVVSLASLWAGPLCGHLLSRMGASVIDVESSSRPDASRVHEDFYDLLHSQNEQVSIDFNSPEGWAELKHLVATADVVIEGSRPRALIQLGIDAESIVETGPQIWMSITGHGRTGDDANRIGFGDDAAVAAGLVSGSERKLSGSEHEPSFLLDAVADPLTGLVAAAAISQLARKGGRWLVDLSLSGVAAYMAGRDQNIRPLGRAIPPARRQRAEAT